MTLGYWAPQNPEENRRALRYMPRVLKVDIQPSTALDLHLAARHAAGPMEAGTRHDPLG